MIWIGPLWHLVGVLTDVGPTGLLVGTGVLLTAVLAARVLLRPVTAGTRPQVTARLLRERAERTGIPRHRDPDASGRSRPRAPTAAPAAA